MVRSAVSLAVLGFGLAAWAQETRIPSPGSGQPAGAVPGGVPVIPTANPQNAFAKLPADLQNHLAAWEKRTANLQNLYTECEREVTNKIKNKTVKYAGSIRCMKPNLAYLRIDNTAKKDDFAAYICDGKDVFEYSGADKTVTKHSIPAGGKGNVGDNLLLEFMSGSMTAADVANRFTLKLMKEDQHYVYLEVQPTQQKDLAEFDSLILVLYSANVKGLDYVPAKVRMTRDRGNEVEEWTFKQPMPNAQGIKKEDFRYIEPPKDWQVKQAQPQPKTVRP